MLPDTGFHALRLWQCATNPLGLFAEVVLPLQASWPNGIQECPAPTLEFQPTPPHVPPPLPRRRLRILQSPIEKCRDRTRPAWPTIPGSFVDAQNG